MLAQSQILAAVGCYCLHQVAPRRRAVTRTSAARGRHPGRGQKHCPRHQRRPMLRPSRHSGALPRLGERLHYHPSGRSLHRCGIPAPLSCSICEPNLRRSLQRKFFSPQPRQTLSVVYPHAEHVKWALSDLSCLLWRFNAHLGPSILGTLPFTPLLMSMTHTSSDPGQLSPQPSPHLCSTELHIGLAPYLHKCAVYGTPGTPADEAAQQTARILDIRHAADGFVAAGAPIGINEYITTYTEDRADQAIAVINKLRTSHHPLLLKAGSSSSFALSNVALHIPSAWFALFWHWALCTPVTTLCPPASRRTGTSAAHHAVPLYPEGYRVSTLSGCHPGVIFC
jgi:hypothetical protein